MRRLQQFSIFLSIAVVILAACTADNSAVQEIEPTATLLPILSHTPRFTATPVPTRTPLPTFTPIPSETPIPPTPSNTPAPTLTPTIVGIVQSIQRVNVRDGPGVSFSAFESLAPGTGVQVIGQNTEGDWFNIRMEDGTEGWISSRLMFIPDTPTPFPTATPSPDLTALFLGTPLPTAVIGGGTLTPTPPGSVSTSTPISGTVPTSTELPTATEPLVPIVSSVPQIDITAINLTATALATSAASDTPTVTLVPTPTPTQIAIDALTSAPTVAVPVVDVSPEVTAQAGTAVAGGSTTTTGGIDVFAFCDNNNYGLPAPGNLRTGQSIDIYWAWFAKTRDQIQQHLDTATYEIRVNGNQIPNVSQFRQQMQSAGNDQAIYWYIPFGPLEVGQYQVTYRVSWNARITDGYEFFGPGSNKPFEEETCTFVVTE